MTIAETANGSIDHARRYRDLVDDDWESGTVTASEFVTSSVVKASFLMPDVAAIIALVDTGRTAARIAKYRPRVPIIAVVPKSNARFARQLYGAHRGMFPVLVEVLSGAERCDMCATCRARISPLYRAVQARTVHTSRSLLSIRTGSTRPRASRPRRPSRSRSCRTRAAARPSSRAARAA